MPRRFQALILISSLSLLAGCGGGGSNSIPQMASVKVLVTPMVASVPAGTVLPFFVSVTGATNRAVTWQVNGVAGGDATVGTVDTSGIYTAPGLVPSPQVVTLSAVSQADTTKSGSAAVTIALGLTPSSQTMNISDMVCPSTQQFTATGSSSGYNFSVNGVLLGDPVFGTITNSGFYTAPGAIPESPVFSVSASSAADATEVGTASVTLQSGGPGINQALQPAPIHLGTSGGNLKDTSSGFCCSGTLGSLVTRNGTNFILSNNHVLARSGHATPGEQISQPGLVDTRCGMLTNAVVANFTQAVKLNPAGTSLADAALAQVVNNEVDPTGAILGLGPVSCGVATAAPPASTTGMPAVNMLVAKSGRTSGLTCGHITDIDLAVQVQYDNACGSNSTFLVNYDHQIDILSTTFSAPGDSGSLIVDSQTSEPVALLYAGSDTDTVANPIQDVLTNLADPQNHALPTFVGGAQHPVEACIGTGASSPVAGQAVRTNQLLRLSDGAVIRASSAKAKHMAALMKIPAVIGVGVGAGDLQGQAAIFIYVEKGKTAGALPLQVDGIPTKIRVVKPFKARAGSCPWSDAAFARKEALR
jgi:hypothetical protein